MALKLKRMLSKIPMGEAILILLKIYAMIYSTRISFGEIPEKSQKMAGLFGMKLSSKILRN